jgi:hypothetical protein
MALRIEKAFGPKMDTLLRMQTADEIAEARDAVSSLGSDFNKKANMLHVYAPVAKGKCAYTVAGTMEIKQWIYSWLPHAEVLEPAWFREQVEKELSASLERHS